MNLSDFSAFISGAETLLKLPLQLSWGALLPCFFGAPCVMALSHFPSICDKLNPMYGILYHGFAALWTLALFCIVCKLCASGGEKIKRKQEQREQEKAFLERQAQQRELLRTLSSGERRVLSRVLSSTSGGAWVRVDDVAATVLLHKGLLTTVSRGISGRYNARIDDYERCILVGIPEDLKEAAADVLKGYRRNKKTRAPAGKTRAEP